MNFPRNVDELDELLRPDREKTKAEQAVIEAAKRLRHAAWLDKCAMDLPKEEVRFIVAVDALLAAEGE